MYFFVNYGQQHISIIYKELLWNLIKQSLHIKMLHPSQRVSIFLVLFCATFLPNSDDNVE